MKSFNLQKISFLLFLIPMLSYGQTKEIKGLQKKLHLIKDSTEYVNKLNRIGILMHLKNPDSCIFYGTKARKIASRIGYKKGATDADNVIGIALALKGLTNEAMQMFSKVLLSYQEMGDTANEVQVLMNFASTNMQLRKEKEAIHYSRLALKKGATIPKDSIMAKAYTNYCMANTKLADDSISYYMSKSNAIGKALKDEQLLIGNQQVQALFYLTKGRRSEALPLLESSFEQAKKAALERLQILGLNLMSFYYSSENPQLALSISEQQYKLAEENGYDDLKVEVLFSMQQLARQAGFAAKENEVNQKLILALVEKEQKLGKFIGDYVTYGKLQEDFVHLEKSEKFSKQATIVLASVSIIGIILSLLLLRAHIITRQQSKRKSVLNAVIEEQNSKLRHADEFKSRLVSILAHDFRSPLLSTLSLIRLLEEEESLDEADKAIFYKTLQDDISGLLGQFDTTLQWIRQQLRGESMAKENADLKELFRDCCESLNVLLAEKNITVFDTIPDGLEVYTDKEMLQFVNRNLLSNALKFSPEGGQITISAQVKENNVVVSVTDSGPGISDDKMDQLFKITDAGGSTERGAGIALSMSRDFIESLGGTIWAVRAESSGTTFSYTLPVKNL